MIESVTHPNSHPFKLNAIGLTDTGRKRNLNEDSIEVNEPLRLFAVADGMGGHAAGEVASRTAIHTIREFVGQTPIYRDMHWPLGVHDPFNLGENILQTAVELANLRLCQLSSQNEVYNGMGTTLAAIYAPDRRVHIAHVGDSRVYRRRGGHLEQLTSDHSWVNEQIKRNLITEDEARNHRWRNIITRALGNHREKLEIDLKSVPIQPGDVFLLCSDGLTGMVDDQAIAEILDQAGEDLEVASDALVQAANEAGGEDNISVVLIQALS